MISIQTENVMEKYKMFAKINLNQTQLINSLIQSNDRNSTDTVLLNKYYTHEILTGIQIIERLPYENREMFEQLNAEKPWYDIVFNTLPDSCMDFDSNSENYPEQLKKNMSHLSNSCVEFYKSIFRVSILLLAAVSLTQVTLMTLFFRSERLQPVSFLRRQTTVFSLTIWMIID